MTCGAHAFLVVALCFPCAATTAAADRAPRLDAQRIDPPKIIKRVEPEYPDGARRAGIAGVVVVEANIGVDGKVQDAKVLQSIPELDEAALAAVRQWEFAPTIVNGVAQAVIMTVRVGFTLSDKATAGREHEPIIVSKNDTDWTFNGTPLLDDNLRHWLSMFYVKQQVIVDARVTKTYAGLVDVLVSVVGAGVRQPFVFGGSDPKQAVRVTLERVSGAESDLRMPTADIEGEPVKIDVEITLAGDAAIKTALAAMRGVRKGAVIRLRADGSRSVADVWEILSAGQAAGVGLFALAVRAPEPPLVH
jgi:TonB family protein